MTTKTSTGARQGDHTQTEDANRMREVNNAIYDDVFWVHLAYLAAADGVEDLRRLLRPHRQYAALLSAFETIDRGRAVLADQGSPQEARREAHDMVWAGNLALLEHEQRVVVQPLFDRLSGTFARLVSMGSTTTFEVRGLRQEARYFTSISAYSLTGGFAAALRTRTVPRASRGSTTVGDGSRPVSSLGFDAWTPTRTWWTGRSAASWKRRCGTPPCPASSRPEHPARASGL